jgi:hypothetical protein
VTGSSVFTYTASGSTGPVGNQLLVGAPFIPTTGSTYDIGATGQQFKNIHFSGALYNNGVPFTGAINGITYTASGPTGPTGPQLLISANLIPLTANTYDLGATSVRFHDMNLNGQMNIEVVDATGYNIRYTSITESGNKHTITNVYGPSGADGEALLYSPSLIFRNSRDFTTGPGWGSTGPNGENGPTGLLNEDYLGTVLFNDDKGRPATIVSKKLGSVDYSLSLNVKNEIASLTLVSAGTTGPTGPQILVNTHVLPTEDSVYDLGASGSAFRDLFLSGNTLHLGGSVISASGPSLSLNGSALSAGSTTVFETALIAGKFVQVSGEALASVQHISMSASGQYITFIAGVDPANIYVSINYGTTFTQITGNAVGQSFLNLANRKYSGVSVSSTGQYQTVIETEVVDQEGIETTYGGGIFVSSDYGVTWKETYATYTTNTVNALSSGGPKWTNIAVSSDGTIQVATSSSETSRVVISQQKVPSVFADWTDETSIIGFTASRLTMNDSGDRFSVMDSLTLRCYYLTFIGAGTAPTLTQTSGAAIEYPANTTINGLSLSRDGTVVVLTYNDEFSNYSIAQFTWTTKTTYPGVGSVVQGNQPTSIAMTSNGSIQVIKNIGGPNGILISTNYGASFTLSNNASISAVSVAQVLLSSNGQYAFIVDAQNDLYKCFVPINTYSIMPYTPAVMNDWPTGPTSVGNALDLIAQYFRVVGAINSKTFNDYSGW